MFLILVYDVRAKRVAKVRKTVLRYLHPVQESVFNGDITQSSYKHLKADLFHVIQPEEDYVRVYCLSSIAYADIEELGTVRISEGILI